MPKSRYLTRSTAALETPRTQDEYIAAAELLFARATAELAKTAANNPRHFALVERALYHREVIATKEAELQLIRDQLDRNRRRFDDRLNRPGRLLSIEIHDPEEK